MCCNRSWHWQQGARGQAGTGSGNLSKYIYALFSPQRHLWSTASFSNTFIQFTSAPRIRLAWNNRWLIQSPGKPEKTHWRTG